MPKRVKKKFQSRSNHRYLIEVDCSLGQFKSAKLKDQEYAINAPISQYCKKRKKDGCTKFLTFVGRWSADSAAAPTSIRYLCFKPVF